MGLVCKAMVCEVFVWAWCVDLVFGVWLLCRFSM